VVSIFFPRLISAVGDWSSQLRHVSTIGKKLVNMDTSSTCPRNMVNFGLLTAEICWRVWATPANFNEFRVLAALLHDTSGRQPNFAALNRGRHLYLAGRPSRWALAHILVELRPNDPLNTNFGDVLPSQSLVVVLQKLNTKSLT